MAFLKETLADLSRERRRMRAEGLPERYVIWFQTGKRPPPKYATVLPERPVAERQPKRPHQPSTHFERQCQPEPGPFTHYPRMSKAVREREIAVLSKIQEGRCYLCSRRFGDGWARVTFDHVVPFSQCGTNQGNGLAACAMCNYEKGDRMPTEAELKALTLANVKREKLVNAVRNRAKKSYQAAWALAEFT